MPDDVSRRRFIGVSAAGGTAAGLIAAGGLAPSRACAATAASTSEADIDGFQPPSLVTVTSSDPRYGYLTTRGMNTRFTSTASTVYQVFSAQEVVQAVQRAVNAGQRIAVRSGGHCLDGLVDNSSVQAVIDVSRLNQVYFDTEYQAFAIEAGVQLGDAYKELWLGWNVVIPGGTCPTVGAGGYVQGGGFGAMCRQYGMCVDHLYGVELVIVNASGQAELVVATNEASDPRQDLFWAHTGSGGGNFGVVTRYLFRTPGRTGAPSNLLPSPPATTLVTIVSWPWSGLTQAGFSALVSNYCSWMAANSAPGGQYASMFAGLLLEQATLGQVSLICEIDGTLSNATSLMSSFVSAVGANVGVTPTTTQYSTPWLDAALAGLYGGSASTLTRNKGKGAYLREPYTSDQIDTLYTYLSDDTYPGLGAIILFSYGGQVNAVDPAATANPHRDSIILSYMATYWSDPTQDDEHITWVRQFDAALYASTGGVPAPGTGSDGTYINYPDVDLADPAQNTSGIPWYTLYFKDNYARLQQVKQSYDPGDVFQHPLSIELPG